jgi:hypothetical protein
MPLGKEKISEENQFIKGFNNGYLLAEFEPKLIKSVLQTNYDSPIPYIQGLVFGEKEFKAEKFKARIQSSKDNSVAKEHDNDFGLEREQ